VFPAALHQQARCPTTTHMRPRRAGSLRMVDTNAKPRLGRGGGVWHPLSHADPPRVTAAPRLQAADARVGGLVGNPGGGRISCLTTNRTASLAL
jgi:hypothetical protein